MHILFPQTSLPPVFNICFFQVPNNLAKLLATYNEFIQTLHTNKRRNHVLYYEFCPLGGFHFTPILRDITKRCLNAAAFQFQVLPEYHVQLFVNCSVVCILSDDSWSHRCRLEERKGHIAKLGIIDIPHVTCAFGTCFRPSSYIPIYLFMEVLLYISNMKFLVSHTIPYS